MTSTAARLTSSGIFSIEIETAFVATLWAIELPSVCFAAREKLSGPEPRGPESVV